MKKPITSRDESAQKSAGLGFTLIELMITVAIVAILAAIAIPRYDWYRFKAKTAEARTILGGIRTAQEAFNAENDNYANIITVTPANYSGAVKQSWPITSCPAVCDKLNTFDCIEFECIGFRTASVHYRYRAPHRTGVGNISQEFAIGAQTDLDADAQTSSWGFRSNNSAGTVGIIGDGLSACPADVTSNLITNCTPVNF